jgi:hypothetical protein
MKTMFFVLAGLPFVAAPLAANSAAANSISLVGGGGLVRVNAEANDFDRAAWRAKLGGRDLEARERAFEELVALARRDDTARAALREWADAKDDADLAWTSRLALREVERTSRKNADARVRSRTPAAPDWSGLRDQMSDLQRRFGGMDSLFGDLQREMDELMQQQGAAPVLPPGGSSSRAQSFTLRSGPDGVEARVQENVNGRVEEKTYTAKTLDELYAAHPELQGRVQLRSHSGLGGPLGGGARTPQAPAPFSVTPFDATPFEGQAQPLLPNSDGPRLGAMVAPVTDDEARELGLDAGRGLKIARVLPGTYAEQLGLQAGDVLVELDGTAIASREDVANVLAQRKDGDALRATVIDAQRHERKLTLTNPTPPKPAPARPQVRDSSRRF